MIYLLVHFESVSECFSHVLVEDKLAQLREKKFQAHLKLSNVEYMM